MTREQKLDRPDREKILDIIATRCHSNLDYPCDCQPRWKEQCWGKVADQILALCEKEIREQERERIIKYLDQATDTRDLDRRLQSLKEEMSSGMG